MISYFKKRDYLIVTTFVLILCVSKMHIRRCAWVYKLYSKLSSWHTLYFSTALPSGVHSTAQHLHADRTHTIRAAVLARSRSTGMSAVWKYFDISEKDGLMAICKLCSAEVSRGGVTAKTFSTSGLINHLSAKHKDKHDEFKKLTAQKFAQSYVHACKCIYC